MSFTQVTLTGTVTLSNSAPANGATVTLKLSKEISDGTQNIYPQAISTRANSSGAFSITVNANDDITTVPTGTSYIVTITYGLTQLDTFRVVVSYVNAPSVDIFSLVRMMSPSPPTYGVSSFNTRTGAIAPQGSDYAAFYDELGDAAAAQANAESFASAAIAAIATPGPSYNVSPANTAGLRRAIAAVRTGNRATGPLFCAGDSITEGFQSTYPLNFPTIMTALLNQLVPTAQTWAMPHNDGTPEDPRVTLGTNWAINHISSMWGWKNAGSSGVLSYAPCGQVNGPTACDTVDIWNIQFSGFTGTFTVDIGSGTLATISNTNAGNFALFKTTIALGAPGTPTINLTPVGGNGNTWIAAIVGYNSTSPVIEVANAGLGGTTAANWSPLAGANAIPLAAYAPAFTLLNLGTNDAAVPETPAVFQADMQSIITSAQLSGGIAIGSMIPSGLDAPAAVELTYLPVFTALSNINNIPYFDNYDRWVSFSLANSMGFMTNVTHPTAQGYADIAAGWAEVLKLVA